MKEFLKSNTDESVGMIVLGILTLYFLVVGFVLYLFLLHRISLIWTLALSFGITLIYIPRFLILNKIAKKDVVKIEDDAILLNSHKILFGDIKDFRVEEAKPKVVFFINNKMILFSEAKFRLRLNNSEVDFVVIGSEKIRLLKEFLSEIIK